VPLRVIHFTPPHRLEARIINYLQVNDERRLITGWTVRDRIPVGTRFPPPLQTGPGAHPASCTMGTGSLPGVKYGQGVLLTTHPLLVPRSWKSRAIPLPNLWATPGL